MWDRIILCNTTPLMSQSLPYIHTTLLLVCFLPIWASFLWTISEPFLLPMVAANPQKQYYNMIIKRYFLVTIKNILVILITAAAVSLPLYAGSVAAQDAHIEINTDASLYEDGDTMIIYGEVPTVLPDEQMRLQILYRTAVILVDQFDVAQDGTFTYVVNIQGSQWTQDGQYTVRVWYGNDNTSKYFDFITGDIDDALEMFEVADGRGGTFDVSYAIRGGVVKDMHVDYESLAIQISIDAERGGRLLLDLPREYIDSIHDDNDTSYIVLVNGIQTSHTDDMGSDTRRIVLNFGIEATDITIIGTQVVPEFGTVLIILVVGIAIIVSSTRIRTFL